MRTMHEFAAREREARARRRHTAWLTVTVDEQPNAPEQAGSFDH
jgi:hypothetical protein